MSPAGPTEYRRARTAQRVALDRRPAYAQLLRRWSEHERETRLLGPLMLEAHENEGVTQSEMAAALGLTASAVGARVRVARKHRDTWPPHPGADTIGWCHSCGTFQRGADARWLRVRWDAGFPDWVCVNCSDEPWGLGVWTHTYAVGHRDCGPCADARCVSWDGECLEHG